MATSTRKNLISFKGKTPSPPASVWVAPTAYLTGDIEVGEDSSFFFGAVARGDINPIRIGYGTNIQDHAMLHTSNGLGPCTIGNEVTIGHRAIIHGATIMDRCIVGMGAVVLDGAIIEKNCIIGAQALVPMKMVVPEGSLVVGVPGKVVRKLSSDEIEDVRRSALHYVEVAKEYARELKDRSE